MKVQFIISYVLNIIDLVFTSVWVNKYGIDIEMNSIGKLLYTTNTVYAVKIFVIGALFILLYKLILIYPKWSWVATAILIVYTLLVVYHILIAIILWCV